MLIPLIFCMVWAIISPLLHKKFKHAVWVISALPLFYFFYYLSLSIKLDDTQTLTYFRQWMSHIGLNISFEINGLSLLFALLITGIGFLIFIYSSEYLKTNVRLGTFYSLLILFMGAMLGLVMSNNLILMFIFWELTSILSFFLIAFENNNAQVRMAALKALLTTFTGGLALFSGFLILGEISGSFEFSELLKDKLQISSSPLFKPAMILVLIGSFSKSAQFPLHFWLPDAMVAHSPVSSFLHSATMVKAGIFLLLKFYPIFSPVPEWNYILLIVGAVTMLFGGFSSIINLDLKKILAYSTINTLGLMVFLIGFGNETAMLATVLFLFGHALYKGSFFLIAGIVQHYEKTRMITELKGLKTKLPLLATIGLLTIIFKSGFPPSLNFITKELIFQAAFDQKSFEILYVIVISLSAIFFVVSSFMVGYKPFFTKDDSGLIQERSKIPMALILPPAILTLTGFLTGFFPFLIPEYLFNNTLFKTFGQITPYELKLIPDLNFAFYLSTAILILGVILYFAFFHKIAFLEKINSLFSISPPYPENSAKLFYKLSIYITKILQSGYLRIYIITILVLFVGIMGYILLYQLSPDIDFSKYTAPNPYELLTFVLIASAILATIFIPTRLSTIASLGIIGFGIALIFVYLGAPDLSITQFTIDTLTVIIFVLIVFKLPKFVALSSMKTKLRDALIAISCGIIISFIVLAIYDVPVQKTLSEYYIQNSYALAKGKNIVNVILVDFRGFDTFLEITVLAISALGVYSLLKTRR